MENTDRRLKTNRSEEERKAQTKKALETRLATGKSPKELSREKRAKTLVWIHRQGFTTAEVLRLLHGNKTDQHCKKLVKEGWLKQTETERGHPKHFYTLTRDGLEAVSSLSQCYADYPEIDPYRVNQNIIRHNTIAQKATVSMISQGQVIDYQTERMINGEGDKPGIKRPDVIWVNAAGGLIAVEIELSPKYERRLDQFVQGVVDALKNNTYSSFYILSNDPVLIDRYKTAMSNPVQQWRKDKRSSKWITQKDSEGKDIKLTPPDWLLDRIRFKQISSSLLEVM